MSGMYVCKSSFTPLFFCTAPRVYGIIFTPSIVFLFLSLGITSRYGARFAFLFLQPSEVVMKVCTRYEMTWADAKFPILRLFNARSKPNICTLLTTVLADPRGSVRSRRNVSKLFKNSSNSVKAFVNN